MMCQCINEERDKMSFMRMKPSLHSYLDNLCLSCNLENNNRWNYALGERCFIIVLNVFRWCVTLDNRVHDISIETSLRNYKVQYWQVKIITNIACVYTPSILIKHVVLDKISFKHWEYKPWISFKLLSLKMWKLHERICLAKYFHKSIVS
jgi:hypothetical protein